MGNSPELREKYQRQLGEFTLGILGAERIIEDIYQNITSSGPSFLSHYF